MGNTYAYARWNQIVDKWKCTVRCLFAVEPSDGGLFILSKREHEHRYLAIYRLLHIAMIPGAEPMNPSGLSG
jgi:hypothetical protein